MSLPRANFDLDAALAEAERRYVERNPKSRAAIERASAYLPGGNTRTVIFYPPFPIVIARSEGARIWDLDGHSSVDFLGEYTAGLFGHSDATIRAAIEGALERGWVHGGHIENEARLAEALCRRFPSLQRVRFCNSGTEANLMALATARAVTGRDKIMAFPGGYHGGVLLFKNGPSRQNAPFPVVLGAYNDAERTLAAVERAAGDLAAIIIEPMQGSGGCIPAERAFLAALREAATRHGIILVFDEVMTSRLGPAGLQGMTGVVPDMTTLGKYVGGGLSFGAFGGRAEIMDRFDPRRPDALVHAGTFNNNALTMAAGVAAMTEVYTPARAEALTHLGEEFRARLGAAARERGVPAQATGIGSMMTVHFVAGPIRSSADLEPASEAAKALFHLEMLARGQHVARRGMINLSLPMTERELDGFVDAFAGFLDEYAPVLRNTASG
jgi:glutamate-1-semialdehyde 2,1-aminomutase